MGRNFIEKRIIKAGTDLCKQRIEQKGTPITAEDLNELKVRTISPVLQVFYFITGLGFMVFGTWVHIETRSMVLSFLPVLVGFGNVCFAVYGNPRKVSQLGGRVDIKALSTDIIKSFVREMDAKRDSDPSA